MGSKRCGLTFDGTHTGLTEKTPCAWAFRARITRDLRDRDHVLERSAELEM